MACFLNLTAYLYVDLVQSFTLAAGLLGTPWVTRVGSAFAAWSESSSGDHT